MKHPTVIMCIVYLIFFSGCTSPLVEINRTGSALPDVQILNGSLNGNNTNVEGLPL